MSWKLKYWMYLNGRHWLLSAFLDYKAICSTPKHYLEKQNYKAPLYLFSFHFSCAAVDCGRLPAPLNGSLSGEKTTYPNHVEINCDQGFILRGSHKRTCQADGRWDGNKTLCKGNEVPLMILSRQWGQNIHWDSSEAFLKGVNQSRFNFSALLYKLLYIIQKM